MSNFIALKDKNGDFRHYKCSEEIYTYIKQLEFNIRYPGESKLKDLYPQRFNRRFSKEERDNWM